MKHSTSYNDALNFAKYCISLGNTAKAFILSAPHHYRYHSHSRSGAIWTWSKVDPPSPIRIVQTAIPSA